MKTATGVAVVANGRMIDGTGTAAIADAAVVIRGGRIVYAGAAKGFQGIVCKTPLPGITADFAAQIVGGKPREAHRAGFNPADARAKGVFLAYCTGDDGLKIHHHFFEEMFRQIAAMETNCLIGIASVVVVPIQQSAWRLRSELQRVHAQNAANIDLART